MEDSRIVDLYWERSEQAIYETQLKYDHYCFSIANNILPFGEDAEEIANELKKCADEISLLDSRMQDIQRRINIYEK